MRLTVNTAVLAVLALLLGGCAPAETPTPGTVKPLATPTPPATRGEPAMIAGEAAVESVELAFLESFPLQMRATIRGNLPDACTSVGPIGQSLEGKVITVTVATVRPADTMCAQVLTPFEVSVPLEIGGLAAGDYTVAVNGVEETFTLAVDNVLPPVAGNATPGVMTAVPTIAPTQAEAGAGAGSMAA
ncbi:MAG: hypothetical protein IT326_01135, partial [Anaerolineae bacterium]|nr:hypothetical protein [Anaerolineae bacterium]